jgi:opacity protein-like surface antigen
MDRVLPFVTAGYAGGNTKDTVTTSSTSYHNGWTVGGGAEFAITGTWTAKVEGLYVHLEPASLPTTGESGMDIGLARAGLNYRF